LAEPAETAADVLSVTEALTEATARLREAGCESPRLDAELLLAEVLGVGRERLVLDRAAALSESHALAFETLVERRAAREPVAYILGRREFRYLTLAVDPRALIPRPETELLVELGLGLAAGSRVVDVGTGSGAVALALASERPDLVVTGTDVSDAALALARGNAERLGLGVSFCQSDLLTEGAPFDAVLANLPYVADGAELAPEIMRYEPLGALFAGPDGLSVLRRLVDQLAGAPEVLVLALEIGAEQAAAVSELIRGAGFGAVEVLRDLAGLDRVVVGRRA
jgi:release factor glutamine methyltransferase